MSSRNIYSIISGKPDAGRQDLDKADRYILCIIERRYREIRESGCKYKPLHEFCREYIAKIEMKRKREAETSRKSRKHLKKRK